MCQEKIIIKLIFNNNLQFIFSINISEAEHASFIVATVTVQEAIFGFYLLFHRIFKC